MSDSLRSVEGNVLITHAFSRTNAGDGLLVDLTIDRLVAAGVSRDEMTIAALDPESFSEDLKVVRAPGDPFYKLSPRVARSAVLWVLSGFKGAPEARAAVESARAVVGVGGGYLRSDSATTAIGALINHGHLLKATAMSRVPSIYLPQSIGPLRGPIGREMGSWLSNVDHVCVRDDESVEDLKPYTTVRRLPDLAVMDLVDRYDEIPKRRPEKEFVVVPRSLGKSPQYTHRLQMVGDGLPAVTWAVQAGITGPKDDAAFIKKLGFEVGPELSDLISQSLVPRVVVSVRLHGALGALLKGWPAIHLSYGRKGWAAYRDLGLQDWVHDAFDFDPDLVVEQARELVDKPELQWQAIDDSRAWVGRRSAELSDLLANLAAG